MILICSITAVQTTFVLVSFEESCVQFFFEPYCLGQSYGTKQIK